MSSALAPVQNGALATANQAELDLIRTQYAKVLNDHEFQLFVAEAKHRRLDILQGHFQAIRFKGNNEPATFYPTVHGLLALADTHPMNDGIEGPHYCGPTGEWREVWTDKEPYAARVIVHRKDRKFPTIRIAYMSERKRNSPIWASMPRHMLGKTALTDALKASGLINEHESYVTEEVDLLPDGTFASVVEDRHGGAMKRVHAVGAAKGFQHDEIRGVVRAINPGVESMREAAPSDLNQAGDLIEHMPASYVAKVASGEKRLDEPTAPPPSTPDPTERDQSKKPTPHDWSNFWKWMKSFGHDAESFAAATGKRANEFKTPEAAKDAFLAATSGDAADDGPSDDYLEGTPLADLEVDSFEVLERTLRLKKMPYAEFVDILGAEPEAFGTAQVALDHYNETMEAIGADNADTFDDIDPETGEITEPGLPGMGADAERYTK